MPPLPRPLPSRADLSCDWIARVARDGDREAFAQLFRQFAPRLKTYFLRQGLEDDEAEALSQETLLMAWRRAGQFDPARDQACGWIYAIARNLRIDRTCRAARRVGAPATWVPTRSSAKAGSEAPPAPVAWIARWTGGLAIKSRP